MTNRESLRSVTSKVVTDYAPEKVILFGSHAWGEPSESSDIDLFIIKDTDNTRNTAREIDGSIFPRPFPMGIVVYTPAQVDSSLELGDDFIKRIITEGTVLYEKPIS
jgi:uncharacterized protein